MNRIVAVLATLLEPRGPRMRLRRLSGVAGQCSGSPANIIGLVIRRQVAEWSHWGPWVSLLGVAGLAGYFLSASLARVGTGLFLQVWTYLHYGVAYEPGGVSVAQQMTYSTTMSLALFLWSWACGFVLASLSGRMFWITSLLFYCVVQDSWVIHQATTGNIVLKHGFWSHILTRLLPLKPFSIAFLFALVLGVRAASKFALSWNARLCLIAAGLASLLLPEWMESWFSAGFAHWSGQPYLPKPFLYGVLPSIAVAWPLFSILLLRHRKPEGSNQTG